MKRTLPTIVAVLALSTPIHLGEAAATTDAAHYIGQATTNPRTYVRQRASRSGWRGREWRCIDALVYRESRWHPTSKNSHSSAYGLFQFLHMKPGTPIAKQYAQFETYINTRYGSPCQALHFHTQNGWY